MKLKRIEEIEKQDEYWDLEIEDNHNFFVNDILVHNSNGSVCYSIPDGFWVQSRKNIITPEKDNAGCAFDAYAKQNEWIDIINKLAEQYNINLNEYIISVYYEWCGGSIQKNSACSGLDKRAIVFQHFKVSPINPQLNNQGEEISAKWLETKYQYHRKPDCAFENIDNVNKKIFNIMNFPMVKITIDFNEPLMSQNKMIEMVGILEHNSLVGKEFGIDGNTGEGYVFSFTYKDNVYKFKVKGEKHSSGSKVKTLKPVDEEFENKKRTFVNNIACISWRLDQMFTEIQNSKYNGDVMAMSNKDIGEFLKLIHKDIIKEETDKMIEVGLEPKSINGLVSAVAKNYFTDRLNTDQLS